LTNPSVFGILWTVIVINRSFLKPTRWKIITTVILFFLWWIIITVRSFFVLTPWGSCLPDLSGEPTPTPAPLNLKDTMTAFSAIAAREGWKGCPPYAPSDELAYSIFSVSQIALQIALTVILA
jgi:hypothetical protein